MDKKDIQTLLNYNFGDFMKEKLDQHEMKMRKLSKISNIDYTILSKITASKPRKTTYQEFLVIMWALNENVDDFCDYVLGRPPVNKAKREMVKSLSTNESAVISHILALPPHQREATFDLMNYMLNWISKCHPEK